MYLIGLHEDAQKKIQEELDSIFGDDRERHITTDDLKRMKYLECAIKVMDQISYTVISSSNEQ